MTEAEAAQRTRTYTAWKHMRSRCYNPNDDSFKYYGARGITVDPEWRGNFNVFLHDMGDAPIGLSLDRKDTGLGYSKDNCRWATATEQARNKTNTRWITFDGRTLSIAAWAERIGIDVSTLRTRLARWPLEQAMTTGSLAGPNQWVGPRRFQGLDIPVFLPSKRTSI